MKIAADMIAAPNDYLVTFVPAVNLTRVTDREGQPLSQHTAAHGKDFLSFSDRLAEIYLATGPGEFTPAQVLEAVLRANTPERPRPGSSPQGDRRGSALNLSRIAVACRNLTEVLPPEVFAYDPDRAASIFLGNMALASRAPTDDEQEEFPGRRRASIIARQTARVVELEAAEVSKIDLTNYQHALVTIAGRSFCLPFTTREARLAARVVQQLAQLDIGVGRQFDGGVLNKPIWSAMPLAERLSFTKIPKEVTAASPRPIEEAVRQILVRMTSSEKVSATKHIGNDRFRLLTNDLTMEPRAESFENLYGRDVGNLFAPGTHRSLIERHAEPSSVPVTAADIAYAAQALELVASSAPLGHVKAIELLEFVMADQAKDALLAALRDSQSPMTVNEAAESIKNLVERILGSSYHPAYVELVPFHGSWKGGATGRKHVRQTGGQVDPGQTIETSRDWTIRPGRTA